MAAITDLMFDASFLKDTLSYLNGQCGVSCMVMDSEKKVVLGAPADSENLASSYYPFEHTENIGGLLCMALDKGRLMAAEPHILHCLSSINTLMQRESEIRQTSEEMLLLSSQLSFLSTLAGKIMGLSRLQDFCSVMLEEISRSIKADRAFLQASNDLMEELSHLHNMSDDQLRAIKEDESFKKADLARTTIFSLADNNSIMIVPITAKIGSLGYMAFMRDRDKRFFTAYDKKFVGIIGHIISPTIEALRLYDSLQDLYLNTVKALSAAIDAKDEYTFGHSFRVAKYSLAIGRKLDIPEPKLVDLEIAAYMHDLGKIGISEYILGKPAKLTQEEFREIKKHPEMTNKILKPIRLPDFIVDAAVQHHERMDGSGYPFGLKGNDISPFARIIMVADVFDALTSERPYRPSMSVEEALKILTSGVGKEFDRKMVLALVEALRDKKENKEISYLSPELKFFNIKSFNEFLEGLQDLLRPPDDALIGGGDIDKVLLTELQHAYPETLFEIARRGTSRE